MYVSVYGYAFRRALRYGAETWHGVGDGPARFECAFRSDPTKGQRSSRGQVALEIVAWMQECRKCNSCHLS